MRFESLSANLRLAWRNAFKRPGFTATVVLTLALGIGVNSAVFALLDGVLLRPLPYRDPGRLVFVWQTLPQHGVFELEATPFDYASWQTLTAFESVAMIATDAFTISDASPERVRGARVTSTLLPLLGVSPRFGRAFTAAEDDVSAPPAVILSDGLWRRRYGADPDVAGRIIQINGIGHTILGVLPAGVSLPGPLSADDELLLAARLTADERVNEISHNYTVVARVARGLPLAAASAALDAFSKRMATEHPDSHRNIGARLVTFADETVRSVRPTLILVAGAVALLLLAACANSATLLITRAAGRHRETAVRTALGATTGDLMSLSLAESLVYVGLSTALALAFGGWSLRTLLPLFAASLPSAAPIGLNDHVLAFTAAIAAVLTLAFASLLVRQHPRSAIAALRASTRMAGSPASERTQSMLVVTQIAFAMVLLAVAGLLMSSFARLSGVTPGFDAAQVLSFRISLIDSGYVEPGSRIAFTRELVRRLPAAPGIALAAVNSTIPFGGTRGANGVEIQGRPRLPGESLIVDQRHVTSGYFGAMGIPVLRGRSLQESDDEQAEPVVVINRRMAEMYWKGRSPIDSRVRVTAGLNEGVWFRIVGVVENVRHVSLSRDPVPEMYYAYAQAPVGAFTAVVRTSADPASIVPTVLATLKGLDPHLPVYDVRPMSGRIAASVAQTRATMLLLLVTAALASTLAAIAIYGSIWYSVSQRLPEIGIRLALGASRRTICAGVVGRAMLLTAVGAAVGSAAALAGRPLFAALLFETPTTDLSTYGSVVAVLSALAIVAASGPALRATRVDPAIALRHE
jgi:putative ABC transport system permease protein